MGGLAMTGVFAFIPRVLISEAEALGWTFVRELGPPHDHWSVLMQWIGEGEPIMPKGMGGAIRDVMGDGE